jgi:transposase
VGAPPANHYRQIVSPSVFRQALTQACVREGVVVVKMNAAMTTLRCNACGHTGDWDTAVSVLHRCEKCGDLFDQDLNAARNLMEAWKSQNTTESEKVPA